MMTTNPMTAIYTLVARAIVGEVGEASIVKMGPICSECSRQERVVERLEYVFDRWSGEDLVGAMGELAASERLRTEIERRGLRGCRFEEMKVSKAPGFRISRGAPAKELPEFKRLIITGDAEGPETWAVRRSCPSCGIVYFRLTAAGRRAAALSIGDDPPPPRQVYRDSWKGDDIFDLPDRLRPVVTQRLADMLSELKVKEVVLLPAEWVDR